MSDTPRIGRPQRPEFGRVVHWAVARRSRCDKCLGHGRYRSALTGKLVRCLACRPCLTCGLSLASCRRLDYGCCERCTGAEPNATAAHPAANG